MKAIFTFFLIKVLQKTIICKKDSKITKERPIKVKKFKILGKNDIFDLLKFVIIKKTFFDFSYFSKFCQIQFNRNSLSLMKHVRKQHFLFSNKIRIY